MAAFLNNCGFLPTLGGTTDWTYSSALTSLAYQSPTQAGAVNGRVYKIRAQSADRTQWELAEGAYNSSTGVFARTTVLYNSSGSGAAAGQSGAGTKITFSTVPEIYIVELAQDLLSIEEANAFTATQQQQARANLYAAPFDATAYNGMQINGGVDISQELGTTGATLVSGTNKYIADNWEVGYTNASGSATSAAQIAAASFPAALPGYNFALQIKAVAAFTPANGDLAHFRQRVEGNRVARLGWGTASAQPITIAFQFYSTVSGVSFVRVYNSAGIRAYYIEFTVAAGWQWVTLTIPGDTTGTWVKDTGIGLFIDIFATGKQASPAAPGSWGGAGSIQTTNSTNLLGTINNVVALTGFLLLPGLELPNAARAPLIMRPADEEFQRCLRHWEKSYGYNVALGTVSERLGARGAAAIATSQLLGCSFVPKRAIPAVTLYSYNGTSGTWSVASTDADTAAATPADIGLNGWFRSASSGLTVGVWYYGHFVANARL
jgi:hypothetical protein